MGEVIHLKASIEYDEYYEGMEFFRRVAKPVSTGRQSDIDQTVINNSYTEG